MNLTDRLRTAADYMTEHGWTQGIEQDAAGHVCLTGAIRYCAPVDGDTYLIRAVLRQRGRAEGWNDADGRTEGEVLTLLRTLEVTDADLAATFGPQWAEVVALVRRAATLTPDEGKQLAAAGAAAGDAARDAARDAAWAAAGDAAWAAAGAAAGAAARAAAGAAARAAARAAPRDAARDAAGDAAWAAAGAAAGAAAWDAAGAAARALVVRDLIGQHGFAQAHYDALTKVWRATIGPVHPDDADLGMVR